VEAIVSDNRQTLAAAVVGAVLGGLAGYLFFTPRGRALRSQFEPALDDMMVELTQLRRTAVKASDVVGEGWKLLNEALRDGTEQDPRWVKSGQTSPF
jgi:flagellar motor component MotA